MSVFVSEVVGDVVASSAPPETRARRNSTPLHCYLCTFESSSAGSALGYHITSIPPAFHGNNVAGVAAGVSTLSLTLRTADSTTQEGTREFRLAALGPAFTTVKRAGSPLRMSPS